MEARGRSKIVEKRRSRRGIERKHKRVSIDKGKRTK
jgi:hypothetical protein